MGFVSRSSFARGWTPDADAVNAPPDALLRADNLVLDEKGVLALRAGSTKINSSPFADIDIHSLFTSVINGTRYRMAGASNAVYANGASIASGLAGSNDVAFGFQLGQILFARSTSKKKYDGSTVRNWGISMTGVLPTADGAPQDGRLISALSFAEAVANLSDGYWKIEAAAGAIVWEPNHYLTTDPLYDATGALRLDLAPTNRAVYARVGTDLEDLTAFNAGGVGSEDDEISIWLYLSDPKLLEEFAVQFDVNEGYFKEDWYTSPSTTADLLARSTQFPDDPTAGDALPTRAPLKKGARFQYRPRTGSNLPTGQVRYPKGGTASGAPAAAGGPNTAGWMHVKWKRKEFVRHGDTPAKGWATVRGIRILVTAKAAGLVTRVETLRIGGGAILGSAEWRYVYVRNASGYLALSAPSAPSVETPLSNQDGSIQIPSDASRDSQVNEIWVFRRDQLMDQYYRTYVKTGVSGTGGYTVTDNLRTSDALTLNIPLEEDNAVPPDNIIAIVGPHFDRTLVLTSDGDLWVSRKLNPDSFATGHVIAVCGVDETPYWMIQANQGVFIGTSKDVYELQGTGAELADGGIDYILRDLGIDHRPVNAGLAHEGDQIAFFSDDGWRASQGNGTTLLTGETGELYKGKTRHGVSPVNVATGRVRAALSKGQLVAITPEGASTTSSSVLYRLVFKGGIWYRHTYAQSGAWRSIHREPDGTVIAGDATGTVWVLDSGTLDHTSNIAVVLWTKVDDLGLPYQRKKIGELQWRSDTGAANASLGVHLDGSAAAATTLTANQNGMGRNAFDLAQGATAIAILRHLQVRLTGSFPAFHLYDYGLQFRERPVPVMGRLVESHGGSVGVKILSGFILKGCTLGAARVITAYLDGVADTETFSLTTSTEEPETHTLRFTLTGRRATDIQLSFDGEIEVDSWSPIVTHRQPVGVKVWDSGPFMDVERELAWLRAIEFKVRAGADLVITPYFDGVAFPTVTMAITTANVDTVLRVPVGRSYVGRQPRIVVKSCEPFYPYWVRAVRRTSGQPSQKPKAVAPFRLETGGVE